MIQKYKNANLKYFFNRIKSFSYFKKMLDGFSFLEKLVGSDSHFSSLLSIDFEVRDDSPFFVLDSNRETIEYVFRDFVFVSIRVDSE